MYIKKIFFLLFIISAAACTAPEAKTPEVKEEIATPMPPPFIFDSLHMEDARKYCLENNYNPKAVILVNLSPHSGNYRMFGMNTISKDTLFKGLVTHGHCKKDEGRFAEFSNEPGCNCSSLGKYRVGIQYIGEFGQSFKLHGLESTNNNAFARAVVLHSHNCVPDEALEDDICQSEGCPTVAPETLNKIINLVNTSNQKILLWIFADRKRQS